MQSITIYHNPRCSKSRRALEILSSEGFEPTVIEYLKNPLDMHQLKKLKAHFPFKNFVRTNEPLFKNLALSLEDEEGVLQKMVNEPTLMQRPIVIYKGKAIIARPPEKIFALLENTV